MQGAAQFIAGALATNIAFEPVRTMGRGAGVGTGVGAGDGTGVGSGVGTGVGSGVGAGVGSIIINEERKGNNKKEGQKKLNSLGS